MPETIAITITLLLTSGLLISMIYDISKCRNPSKLTMTLAVGVLLFVIFGFNGITYDIEIGKQYAKSVKDPFRPAVIYEVIDMDDDYVQYLNIRDGHSFTNSATIREFYRDIEK